MSNLLSYNIAKCWFIYTDVCSCSSIKGHVENFELDYLSLLFVVLINCITNFVNTDRKKFKLINLIY
jgi:hypothetical protein